jgi:polyferredoxin
VYSGVLLLLTGALATGLYVRNPVKLDIIRDRAALVRDTADGRVENIYRLQIMNTSEHERRFVVAVSGLPRLEANADQPVHIGPAATDAVIVTVRADPTIVPAGSHVIVFQVRDADDPGIAASEKSRFFVR